MFKLVEDLTAFDDFTVNASVDAKKMTNEVKVMKRMEIMLNRWF
jgi:hypothetical protein